MRYLLPPITIPARSDEAVKTASNLGTQLLPHQQHVVDRLSAEDQPGLVAVHGLGSGKTLTSIGAQDAQNASATVLVPAALTDNYLKEQRKHLTAAPPPTNVMTLQRVAANKGAPAADMLVVDEAHKLRESSSQALQSIDPANYKKRLLLTAGPFYNHPKDISTLINLAAGDDILPVDQTEFENKYIRKKKVRPGLYDRLFTNLKPGEVPELNPKQRENLRKIFAKWTDYHPAAAEGFPTVNYKNTEVDLTPKQLQYYQALTAKHPRWADRKVLRNLPPSKAEAKSLNSFLSAGRQIMNSTAAYERNPGPVVSPKVNAAFDELSGTLKDNPLAKAVVYSNYLKSGIEPYRNKLQEAGIPFGEFTGSMEKAQRNQLVRDYNAGKLRALLLSSAGGEGLDLKGTRLLQILEPHWNDEKIRQVIGRGARYQSHADLPEDQRNLTVSRYVAKRPVRGILERLGITKPGLSVDQYIQARAEDKDRMLQQFRDLLAQAQEA